MSHSLSTVALPRFATVLKAGKQPRQRPNPKTQNGKHKITTTSTHGVPAATVKKTTSGFNSRNKEPTWQCVQNCGACCKLEKGPNFPSAEEIFDDPRDIEVFFPLFWVWWFMSHLSYFVSYIWMDLDLFMAIHFMYYVGPGVAIEAGS